MKPGLYLLCAAIASGVVYDLCDWSFARGVRYEREQREARLETAWEQALGYSATPAPNK